MTTLQPWEYVASFSPTGVLPLYSKSPEEGSQGEWVRHVPPRFVYGDAATIIRDPPLLVHAMARSSVFRVRYVDRNTYHLYVDAGELAREMEEFGSLDGELEMLRTLHRSLCNLYVLGSAPSTQSIPPDQAPARLRALEATPHVTVERCVPLGTSGYVWDPRTNTLERRERDPLDIPTRGGILADSGGSGKVQTMLALHKPGDHTLVLTLPSRVARWGQRDGLVVHTYTDVLELSRWFPRVPGMRRAMRGTSQSTVVSAQLAYIRRFCGKNETETANVWAAQWTRVVFDHVNDFEQHYRYPPFLLRELQTQHWWAILSAAEHLTFRDVRWLSYMLVRDRAQALSCASHERCALLQRCTVWHLPTTPPPQVQHTTLWTKLTPREKELYVGACTLGAKLRVCAGVQRAANQLRLSWFSDAEHATKQRTITHKRRLGAYAGAAKRARDDSTPLAARKRAKREAMLAREHAQQAYFVQHIAADSAQKTCPVCLEPCAQATLGCGHAVCVRCLCHMPQRQCPTCRAPIGKTPVYVPQELKQSAAMDHLYGGKVRALHGLLRRLSGKVVVMHELPLFCIQRLLALLRELGDDVETQVAEQPPWPSARVLFLRLKDCYGTELRDTHQVVFLHPLVERPDRDLQVALTRFKDARVLNCYHLACVNSIERTLAQRQSIPDISLYRIHDPATTISL